MFDLLGIPLAFVIVIVLFSTIFKIYNILERKSFLKSVKKRNNRWTDLDNQLPVIDQKRKEVDGSHYQEKPFLVVRGEWWNGYPYPWKTIEITINDKSILRWVCRFLSRRATIVKAYTSDQAEGKMIYDRAHAKRYICS